ncbi:hypothetical protein CC633_14615 [Salmonella enterica subsp. enterica serovar Enteritidis]|nr:hypothetical protein [Salmonella enterica subsp. enterica serovar Enteritidis]
MYTLYHVDMAKRLHPGMVIELSAQATSMFGEVYWKQFRNLRIEKIPSLRNIPSQSSMLSNPAYRELWLEIFRTDHPELKNMKLPSRLNSFFAVESIEDAKGYIARSNLGEHTPIFEVYSKEPGLKFDMTWLDQQFPRDFRQFGYYYLRYWKGLRIEDDIHLANHEKRGSFMEVLLGATITIGKVVT